MENPSEQQDHADPGLSPLPSPQHLRDRMVQLVGHRSRHAAELKTAERDLQAARAYLAIAPKVDEALEKLSQKLFDDLVGVLEEKLTIALQEVLEQPIELRATPEFQRGGASVRFHIERDGEEEDIMRGQGGSVANVLSVGLRMFALTTLDPKQHRMFLVLDEQDCWLRPDLVPKLVKIIHDAGKALGLQVLLISHHDSEVFHQYADKIYRFTPQPDGSCVSEVVADQLVTGDNAG